MFLIDIRICSCCLYLYHSRATHLCEQILKIYIPTGPIVYKTASLTNIQDDVATACMDAITVTILN